MAFANVFGFLQGQGIRVSQKEYSSDTCLEEAFACPGHVIMELCIQQKPHQFSAKWTVGTTQYLHCVAAAIEMSRNGRSGRIFDFCEAFNSGFVEKRFSQSDLTDQKQIQKMLDGSVNSDGIVRVRVVVFDAAKPVFTVGKRKNPTVPLFNATSCAVTSSGGSTSRIGGEREVRRSGRGGESAGEYDDRGGQGRGVCVCVCVCVWACVRAACVLRVCV